MLRWHIMLWFTVSLLDHILNRPTDEFKPFWLESITSNKIYYNHSFNILALVSLKLL